MDRETLAKALVDCFLRTHPHQRIRMVMAGFSSLISRHIAQLMEVALQRSAPTPDELIGLK